jgi:hypothetical protein
VNVFGRKKLEQVVREKRRAIRSKTNAPAIIQTAASQYKVKISDISATGARLIAFDAPPSRQDVQLFVNGLRLFGRIVWRRGEAFGIQFDERLHDYTYAEILEAVEEARDQNCDFDREATLSVLLNKELGSEESDKDWRTKQD